MDRSPALRPSPLSLSDTSGATYMDITYGPEKSMVNSTQSATSKDHPLLSSSAASTSFHIRRGHDWVDPGGPFQPPYTPIGTLPTSHEAYSSWLHEHHATTILSEGSAASDDRDMQGANPQGQSKSSSTKDLPLPRPACASAFDDPETGPAQLCRRPPPEDGRLHRRDFKPSWTPPWRRRTKNENTRQPTFRVWEPSAPSPHHDLSPDAVHTSGEAAPEGRWVTYPSILLTEPPPSADEARYRAQVAKGFRKTHGGRKCQPCIPRWMAIGIIVSLPVLLPVGMGLVALESGQEWWKGRRAEKERKKKVKTKAKREAEEEELARWKIEVGWDDDD